MSHSALIFICVVILPLVLVGCGPSSTSADVAAEEYLDVVVESRKRLNQFKAQRPNVDNELSEAERATVSEIVSPIRPAFSKFAAEVAKMSDGERKAFEKKWQPRFDAIGASIR